MKRTYMIIEENILIVEFYAGDIVADFSDANLLLTEKDLTDYVAFIKNYSRIQGKRKAAYLTSKPN